MNEILDNYKLFAVVFFTIIFMGLLIFKFLFEVDTEDDKDEDFTLKYTKEDKALTRIELDIQIFQKFNKLLPPAAGSIFFLRNNSMTMIFHKRALDGLYRFYEGSKNSEYTFIDNELEELKIDFYHSVEKYLLTFESTSKETSSGYYRVYYNVDSLHLLVDELLHKYDKLSNTSQRRLLES